MMKYTFLIALMLVTPAAADEETTKKAAAEMMSSLGIVGEAEGLKAWSRIEATVTHPRCTNCHVGPDNIPMWAGLNYGETRKHGMNIRGGESRTGAETMACSTCHMTSTAPNTVPNAPPHVGMEWRLAPVAFQWLGKTGNEICEQMRDPERNGGRDATGLVEHLLHEAELKGFIPGAWTPGGDRETPPGSFDDHVKDIAIWGAAGQPCPN